MAMGAAKGQAATLQVEMVCVDELVSGDDRLRRLDELVDWGFVRVEAAPYYAADLGRPSIDPIVLVKLMDRFDASRHSPFFGLRVQRAAAGASDDQPRADQAVCRCQAV
jgi:hypothetical protein